MDRIHRFLPAVFARKLRPSLARHSHNMESKKEEWIPSMLQKSRALPFAFFCFICVVALEVVNRQINYSNGIPQSHATPVFLLRFLPTAIIVGLGFLWKSIVADIKKMTPWSRISGDEWVPASDSVLLNYVNSIEISSFFVAARRKHWAVFFGISTGFLCGAAVAAANSLTYVDLFAVTSVPTKLQRTSRFVFENALVTPNGSLSVPLDHRWSQPYGAVALERLPEGNSVPWTTRDFAFESFSRTTPPPSTSHNSIKANVNALSAKLECQQLRYTITPNNEDAYSDFSMFTLEANAEDVSAAGCSLPVVALMDRCHSGTQAWLNVTRCSSSPGDVRILASVVIPISINNTEAGECFQQEVQESDGEYAIGHVLENVETAGLLCVPSFTTQAALVSANESTGEIVDYDLTSREQETDVHLSVASLLLFLVNPTDNRVKWEPRDLATFDEMVFYVSNFQPYQLIDPFFSILLGHENLTGKTYVENPDLFRSDVEALASTTLAHVLHTFARANDTDPIDGEVTSMEARVFIRLLSLRILQAILVFIGLVAIQQATLLRPKTALREDPGTLAAMALLLAVSGRDVEQGFSALHTSSDKSMRRTLSLTSYRISSSSDALPCLELSVTNTESDPLDPPNVYNNSGWRPFAFRADTKFGALFAFLSVVITLAILQTVSQAHNGLCKREDVALVLYQYIPSVILLLLSYICSGIDSAARSASSYSALYDDSSAKHPLLFNIRDRPSVRAPWSAKQAGAAVAASSVALLLFPFVKIVTASLYPTALTTINRTLELSIDRSLTTNLQSTFNLADSAAIVENAAQFAEWSKTSDLGISQRDGVLENLVFANISGFVTSASRLISPGDEIDIGVPAIIVDVACESLRDDDFSWNASTEPPLGYPSDGCLVLEVGCSTRRCVDVYGEDRLLWGIPISDETRCQTDMWNRSAIYHGHTFADDKGSYNIILAEFLSITGPVANNTEIPVDPEAIAVSPGMFNVSTPTIRAVSCSINLNKVEVNTVFTQRKDYGLNGANVPWRPSKLDRGSVKKQNPYSDLPDWYYPPTFNTHGEGQEVPGSIVSNSLWPSGGTSSNIFQLLASYGEYELHNLTGLLDPEKLSEAAQQMITAYTTELLTSLRPLILQNMSALPAQSSTVPGLETRQGTLMKQQERIRQDLRSTIIIEALLVAVLCCITLIFFRFASSAILPKEPDTIAARLSLLSGSRLIKRLREEGTVSVYGDDPIWLERASLGWWKVDGANGEKWRWGIDIGDGVIRRNWDDPPDDAQVESSTEDIPLEDLRPASSGTHQDTAYGRLDQQDETESDHGQEVQQHDEERSNSVGRQQLLLVIPLETERHSKPQSLEQDSPLSFQSVPDDDADIPALELPHGSDADAFLEISPTSSLSPFPGGLPDDGRHSTHSET